MPALAPAISVVLLPAHPWLYKGVSVSPQLSINLICYKNRVDRQAEKRLPVNTLLHLPRRALSRQQPCDAVSGNQTHYSRSLSSPGNVGARSRIPPQLPDMFQLANVLHGCYAYRLCSLSTEHSADNDALSCARTVGPSIVTRPMCSPTQ